MKSKLIYVWQLPQNLLGLALTKLLRARYDAERDLYLVDTARMGVSLGQYIILGGRDDNRTIAHERGHQRQSMYLGWLYLLAVGIPSALGNLYDRLFHRGWPAAQRQQWYYARYPEAWADKLGGVHYIQHI